MPECLGSVDVAQSSDQTLIEQRGLDRTASLCENFVQRIRGKRRIAGLGTESEIERRAGGMDVERAQRAWIVEHDARPVVERHRGAGESRKRVIGAVNVPVASHAKVRVQRSPVVEHDQLMLTASVHGTHSRAGQGPKPVPRDAAAKRRMKDLDARDRFANHGATQATNGAFDFR